MSNSLISKELKDYNKCTKKILRVTPKDDYSLILLFDNNELRIYDMADKLFGVFEILKDIEKFSQVFIDEFGNIAWDKDNSIDSNVIWNNRIDICKDSIYLNSIPISTPGECDMSKELTPLWRKIHRT